jgi:hypothetical protein
VVGGSVLCLCACAASTKQQRCTRLLLCVRGRAAAGQVVRDSVGKERRQELFSFAAASVLELGLPERLALLQCQDTAARLQFVAAAVQPHLQDLVARVSVQQALVK